MPDINANTDGIMVDIELKAKSYSTTRKQQIDAVRSSAKAKLYGFLRGQLWLLPVLAGLFIILLFAIVYSMAVKGTMMEPILPYISDAGTTELTGGFFTQILSMIAVLTALSAFVRYKQLKYYFSWVMLPKAVDDSGSPAEAQNAFIRRLNNANFAALLLMLVGSFGAILTASFRSGEWIWVHTFGANLIFFGTYAYSWIMVWMIHKVAEAAGLESKPVSLLVFVAVGTMSFVVCMITLLVSKLKCKKVSDFFNHEYRLHWNREKPGYWWHVLSTSTEWVVFLAIALVLFSLANRMRVFKSWGSVRFSM